MRRNAASLALLCAVALAGCDEAEPGLVEPTDAQAFSMHEAAPADVQLGEAMFFDKTLSLHRNQSCAACHDADYGFTGPIPGINQRGSVYSGSVRYLFGDRKPPTAAYAAAAPPLHYMIEDGDIVWVGGNFFDGRATGWRLGSPAAEQALGPFVSPVEQALPDEACVVWRVATGDYADLLEDVLGGADILAEVDFPRKTEKTCRQAEATVALSEEDRARVLEVYDQMGLAIAAFEDAPAVTAFSSKFDAHRMGMAELTEDEMAGMTLFNGKAQCHLCHPSGAHGHGGMGDHGGPLFTDFTYDNLGIPANPLNPVYERDPDFVDLGLGGFLRTTDYAAMAEDFDGAVKVPTLRNVAASPGNAPKAFGHNGVFKSLEQIVHFYNTAGVLRTCEEGEVSPTPAGLARMGFDPECWPAPEVPRNVNRAELGNLGLTDEEVDQLVAFMETLTDGYFTPMH